MQVMQVSQLPVGVGQQGGIDNWWSWCCCESLSRWITMLMLIPGSRRWLIHCGCLLERISTPQLSIHTKLCCSKQPALVPLQAPAAFPECGANITELCSMLVGETMVRG